MMSEEDFRLLCQLHEDHTSLSILQPEAIFPSLTGFATPAAGSAAEKVRMELEEGCVVGVPDSKPAAAAVAASPDQSSPQATAVPIHHQLRQLYHLKFDSSSFDVADYCALLTDWLVIFFPTERCVVFRGATDDQLSIRLRDIVGVLYRFGEDEVFQVRRMRKRDQMELKLYFHYVTAETNRTVAIRASPVPERANRRKVEEDMRVRNKNP